MFTEADILLFKQKNYMDAEIRYREIIETYETSEIKPSKKRILVDAMNGIAYAVKFRDQIDFNQEFE